MNRCFIMGKIVTKPQFDFLYMSSRVSVSHFLLELSNKTKIKTLGFDDVADYIYQELKEGDLITIEGELRSTDTHKTLEIEILTITKAV